MKFLVLVGRILYSLIFLMSITHIFASSTVDQAAKHEVPMPEVLVRIAGVLAIVGGLSILFGYKARLGAWCIVLFLVPVTLFMHNFWTIDDPMMRMNQQINFTKNIALLGAALMIAYFGSGPPSIDNRMG